MALSRVSVDTWSLVEAKLFPFSSHTCNRLECLLEVSRASLVAQMVKNLPAMRETWVRSLHQEDPWRRAWQLTPVFLPRKSHRQKSLAGYSPGGHKESDTTERLTLEQVKQKEKDKRERTKILNERIL